MKAQFSYLRATQSTKADWSLRPAPPWICSSYSRRLASVDRACEFLKLLANPDRLLLLCKLSVGESCVSELEGSLNICQPKLSQQLGTLREEGLVATRREGKHVYYSLASPESIAVIRTLQEQFCQPCQVITKNYS